MMGDAISPTLVSVFLKFLLSNVTSWGVVPKTTKWALCLQWELLKLLRELFPQFLFLF